MRMVSRLQLIYHQVQTTLRNPIFQFERPPPNESKMICLGELKLNLHTLQDLYFGMQKQNRYNLILNQIGCMPNEESTLGTASSKQDIQITSVEAVAFFQNSGPPTVPPQMFDMIPRPQGIVIREPAQEDEYLEQQSPDSVLFKDPSAVLQELTGNSLSQDEIMEEQCAIEADLLAQKLNDPSHTLALASKMVPESCKRGPDASTTKSQEGEPSSEPTPHAMDLSSGKSPEENRSDQSTKPRTRKRQNVSKKEAASKKQQLEAKKVEAASLNWLHPDK
ncbi:hypothetical protein LINGRAHAP2_LOCUS31187 [Linum grandiflorum]